MKLSQYSLRIFYNIDSFSFSLAVLVSREVNKLLKDPIAYEYETTPISINTMHIIRSPVVDAEISPYPTVVIVVTVKYMPIK